MRPLRFLAFSLFFLSALWAESCSRFFPKSIQLFDGHWAYEVAKGRFVSLHLPAGKSAEARDVMLGLVIFRAPGGRPLPLAKEREAPLTFCADGKREPARVRTYPVALLPGKLAGKPGEEGALMALCCRLAGISDAKGRWYDAAMIRRLLKNDTFHGTLGMRLDASKSRPTVKWVDPFAKTRFLPGDRLVGLATMKAPNTYEAMDRIDRCREGERIGVLVARRDKALKISARCMRRFGGGRVSDTFLERFGIRFDDRLRVQSLLPGSEAQKAGLKAGDRLLAVEGERVDNAEAVRKVMSRLAVAGKKPRKLLWERAGFQFFLRPFRL